MAEYNEPVLRNHSTHVYYRPNVDTGRQFIVAQNQVATTSNNDGSGNLQVHFANIFALILNFIDGLFGIFTTDDDTTTSTTTTTTAATTSKFFYHVNSNYSIDH